MVSKISLILNDTAKYYASRIVWQSSANVFRPHFGEGKHQVELVWETIQICSCIQLLNTILTISLFI